MLGMDLWVCRREVRMLSSLQHARIIGLLGAPLLKEGLQKG